MNSKIQLIFNAFIGYMAGGVLKQKAEAALHLYQGKKFFAKKSWDIAWKKFMLAESENHNDSEIQYYLANTYYNMGRFDYAWDHIQKFEGQKDARKIIFESNMRILKASISVQLGHYKKGKDVLNEIIELENEKAKKFNPAINKRKIEESRLLRYLSNKKLGEIYLKEKNYEEAIKSFDKAAGFGSSAEIDYSRGVLEFSRENYDAAIGAFTRAIDGGYKSEEIYFRRAYSQFKKQKYNDARDDFKEVVVLYPEGNYKDSAISFLDTLKSF